MCKKRRKRKRKKCTALIFSPCRMNQLVGDDALVDEEFWKMDLFKEDEEDEEYISEAGIK